MATITKKEFIDQVARKTNQKRGVVKAMLQSFLDHMVEELRAGNRLEFRDFGVFEVRERAARVAQNPKTMQRVEVPARRTVKFKAGRVIRERICEAADHSGNGAVVRVVARKRKAGVGAG